jgi:hypothetical protein
MRGVISVFHSSVGRWNAPPVFAGTHRPSRGDAGTLGLSGRTSSRSRGASEPGTRSTQERISASLRPARATREVCGTVREGDSLAERRSEPLLGSARSCNRASSDARLRARQPRHPRARLARRGRPKAKALGGSSPPNAERGTTRLVVVPVRRRIAEVGRTPSGSEKRAIATGRVESLHGKSVPREREPDHSRHSRAQAREPTCGKRGAARPGSANPHHVSAGLVESDVVSFVLRLERNARCDCR